MTLLSNITTVTVGVGLALCSAASMADTSVSANAGVHNLQFQLLDLNPFDNVASTITFSNSSNQSTVAIQDGFGKDQTFTQENKFEYSLAPLSTGLSTPHSGVWAFGDLFNAVSAKGYETRDGYFAGISSVVTGFTLSANTVLVLSGNIGGSAWSAKLGDPGYFSEGHAGLYLAGTNGNQESAYVTRDWYHDRNSSSYEHFALTFINAGSNEVDGTLFAQAQIFGIGQAAPVPEPETWAMMLGGLAALGAVARRRRQVQKAQ